MSRVRAVHALMLGVLMAAATQAQQPVPPGMMQGPPLQGPHMQGPHMQGPMMHGPMVGPPPGGPAMGPPPGAPMGMPMFQGPSQAAPAAYNEPVVAGPVEQAGFQGDCGGCGDCFDCGFGPGPGCGACGGIGCGDCCPPHGCPVIFNGEVEASFLYMDVDGTQAAGSLDAPSIPLGAFFVADDAGLDDELTVVPRVWLHAQKCEWGIGGRLWYLGDSESDFTPLNLLNLNIIGNYNMERLHAWTGDAEVTYSWHRSAAHHYGVFGNSSFQLGMGVRHAEYENDSLILANASFTDAIAHSSAVAKTDFEGTGITSGIRGTVFLGGRVSLFWGVRGSVIWGDLTTLSQTAATAIYDVDPAAGAINSAGTESDEELFIGEAQLGIQWEHRLKCVPATAFFRVAGEYQYWDIDSAAFSATDSTVQVDILGGPDAIIAAAESRAEAPRLELYGLSIATGFTW